MTKALVTVEIETDPDAKEVTEEMVEAFVLGHLSIQDALMADGHPPLKQVTMVSVELIEPDPPE